ncbi:MAG: HAMP domain-containing histidine kinase [Bacteroidales bacterium]|nr:HAMP domain-containing histidine kinase [Bacteroidales bacterium]
MIRKKAKGLISYIFAEEEDFPLEHRLVLSASIIGILISLIGSLINSLLSTSAIAVLVPIFLSLIVLVLYYFIRFRKIYKPVNFPVICISIIGISTIWIFNGGINGSNVMPALVILILGLLIVREREKIYVILLFLVSNISIFLIQFYRPDLITNFPSETERWIDHLITLIYSSILIYFIIRFVYDNYNIERLKALESERKLIQLNADKDRFISILAHDLRSPFNNLIGFSEELKENLQNLNKDQIESYVNTINTSAKNTYNLLDDLLTWEKALQGAIPFNPKKQNLGELCRDVLVNIKPFSDAKNITVNSYVDERIIVYADGYMLKTVLRNLVGNAVKFTNTGGSVQITAESDNSGITISVSDNGVGMTKENISKLFDIAQVIISAGTAKEKKTELGLLIYKEFVEKHGGRIRTENENGKGSNFRFTLPVVN